MTRGPAARPPSVAVVATAETAAGWCEAFVEAGLVARAVPFAVTTPPPDPAALAATAGGTYDYVVATSKGAFRYLPTAGWHGRRGAAVGPETARRMAAFGFDVDVVGTAGAEALARRLATHLPPAARVLWLRGARANEAGAETLRVAGFVVDEVVAYAMAEAPGFAAAVLDEAARPDVWVFGSGAAAEAWLRVVGASAGARGP
ncbi:MAG: uroporphyrinogen-III synthase, partial [Planctomycetia bacterium]|nr:uroporphyrinogen-III synthase [Planctomycetia bacterium]